ncbi:hypothetical protein BGZ89_008083 [Linnemannia elongata]|nr:hypothetical protein BGZ89_008083 [Linnemannia elongata]
MPTTSHFQLLDDQTKAVESGKEYFLKLANPSQENDALSFELFPILHGTPDREPPIVTLEFIDGITYLKYNNEFLYITTARRAREVGLKGDVPKKHERLRLVTSEEDNTFLISVWDQNLVGYLEWLKCAYAAFWFGDPHGQFEVGTKLILSPV